MVLVGQDLHVRNSMLYATDEKGRLLVRCRGPKRKPEVAAFWKAPVQATEGRVQPVPVSAARGRMNTWRWPL